MNVVTELLADKRKLKEIRDKCIPLIGTEVLAFQIIKEYFPDTFKMEWEDAQSAARIMPTSEAVSRFKTYIKFEDLFL